MWKIDEFGRYFTEEVPADFRVAQWSDFFDLDGRFKINMPILVYNRLSNHYGGSRTRNYATDKDFKIFVELGLVYVMKKS